MALGIACQTDFIVEALEQQCDELRKEVYTLHQDISVMKEKLFEA